MEKVLAVVKKNEHPADVIRYTLDLTKGHPKATVTVVIIMNCMDIYNDSSVCFWIPNGELSQAISSNSPELVKEVEDMFNSAGLKPEICIRTGETSKIICEMMKEGNYDQVVLGDMREVSHKVLKCISGSAITVA